MEQSTDQASRELHLTYEKSAPVCFITKHCSVSVSLEYSLSGFQSHTLLGEA